MKRLAHLGFVLALSVAACGGRVDSSVDQPGGDTGVDSEVPDTRTEDVPPIEGFRSYTATITGVKVTMMGAPSAPAAKPPSEGLSFRVDLDPGLTTDGGARALIAPKFTDAMMVRACCGSKVTFRAGESDDVRNLVAAHGVSSSWVIDDWYDALTVVFDSAGRPIEGRVSGRTQLMQGDVVWSGTIDATVTFTPDTVAPSWRGSSMVSFATVPLPWDERIVETSEPYEGALSLASIFGDRATLLAGAPITQETWPKTAWRGFRVRASDWEARWPLAAKPQPVGDLAGNVAAVGTSIMLDGVAVAKRATRYLRFDDYAGAPTLWGAAAASSSGCRPGRACVAIGPFTHSYCANGSQGGIATRLPGFGTITASVRAVAKRTSTWGGGGTPPTNLVHLQSANPGLAPVQTETTLTWLPSTSEPRDTGWVSVTGKGAGTPAETGIALSVGGIGRATPSCLYGPIPEQWEVTVYVDEISIAE